MRESPSDLAELQRLLDASHAASGPHLRAIWDDHRATAQQVVDTLDGVFEMHLATLAGDGAPLVAPLDGIFFKGKLWFGLPGPSVRARLVRRDRRVSASYTRESFALVVHGLALELDPADPIEAEYDSLVRELYVRLYGPGWIDWHEARRHDPAAGGGFTGWIEPRRMFAKL